MGNCRIFDQNRGMEMLTQKIMKVLIVGSGGREHALIHSLSLSPSVDGIYIAPGEPLSFLDQETALAMKISLK